MRDIVNQLQRSCPILSLRLVYQIEGVRTFLLINETATAIARRLPVVSSDQTARVILN